MAIAVSWPRAVKGRGGHRAVTPSFQGWIDDVPFLETGNTDRGLGSGGLEQA